LPDTELEADMGTLVFRAAAGLFLAVSLSTTGHAAGGPVAPGPSPFATPDSGTQVALLGQGVEDQPDRPWRNVLHAAALNNRVDDALRLIRRGMAVDSTDQAGTTALMVAAAFGNADVAEALLDAGANPNAHDAANRTAPLHFAALAGHAAVIELLLARGAAIEIRDAHGESPLHYAAYYNRGAMIETLAASGADLNARDHAGMTPFDLASRHGRMAAVSALSRLGAREGGLLEAVNAGDLIRVRKLIGEGANVDESDLAGSPLHLAAAKGYVAIAAALLDARADIEAAGYPAGAHPLHLAALVNDAPMAAFLVESGSDVEARDGLGRTPLMVAVAFAGDAVADLLLRLGAKPVTLAAAER
jgi:ankyrin repeat protein